MSDPSETQQISSKLITTLDDPISTALIALDKSLASQTQTYSCYNPSLIHRSAQLNIAYKSLDELTKYAQTRLDGARTSFTKGLQEAKELRRELSDLERRVRVLKDKVRERWPVEYYTVRDEIDG
jgi:hypothetical protein